MSCCNMKISIDFDGTLSRKDVQDFTKSLINKGVDVWICTFRTREYNDALFKIVDKTTNPNDDLFLITDSLGIPRNKIIFTEMERKSKYLDNSFTLHLDDDWTVLNDLKYNTKIKGIDVTSSSYKNKIKRLLGL